MLTNNKTENGTDSDTFLTTVVVESVLSCSLSVLGSFAIFGTYIFIPEIRNSTRKLVTCLTVADLLTALAFAHIAGIQREVCTPKGVITKYFNVVSFYLLVAIAIHIILCATVVYRNDITSSLKFLIFANITCWSISGILTSAVAHFAGTQRKVCTTQSAITTYSSLVSFNLTVVIAIHIFVTVMYGKETTSSLKFLIFANITSWSIPGIIIAAAGANGVLGRATTESVGTGPWCWIKRDHSNYALWMFLTGKGWELLCYLVTTSLYVLLKFYLYLRYRRRRFTEIQENLRDGDQNYLYVWFVLYVLRLWGSVRSMMSLTGVDQNSPGDKISNVFMHLQALGDPAQAFCNCILVCFLDKTVRSYFFGFRSARANEGGIRYERAPLLVHEGQHEENKDDIRSDIHGTSVSYGSIIVTRLYNNAQH